MQKCPVCGKEIEDNSKKCMHCFSYVTRMRRVFEWLKFYVIEPLTFFAALAVLWVMIYNSSQMKNSIDLTRKSVDSIDTAFALTRVQIDLQRQEVEAMKRELDIMRSSVEIEKSKKEITEKESIEKNRPSLEILSTKIEASDSELVLYTDVGNEGFSDAESVFVSIVFKNPSVPGDTARQSWTIYKITKHTPTNIRYPIPTRNRGNFLSLIDVKYSWPLYKQKYETHKYYFHIFDIDSKKFSTYLMDENQGKQVWK